MTDTAISPPHHDDARAKRAVAILVWAQSILGAQMPVHFILGGLAGQMLAPSPAWATLPISATVFGSMCTAPVMSMLMGRYGRRTGFILGALAGALATSLAAYAISEKDFTLLAVASFILGIYMSAHGFYRFAAADSASPELRPKAISWVMAGGLVAALLGPELVKQFKDWMEPIPFAGGYKILVFVNLIGMIPLFFLDLPRQPRPPKGQRAGRPWREILSNRTVVVAMICGMISYALMNLVMTSTPLAMIDCGFVTDDAAEIVRIHVVMMFLPSFFTGSLIARYGAPRIIAVGLLALALCAIVAIMGISFTHFGLALGLLGIGWNFGFIGATSLLAGAHLPEERARVQGLNDFLVFGLVTIASLSSGALMASIGWEAVNAAMLPFLAVAAVALAWLMMSDKT